jgi:hypothetical protein
MKRGPIYLAGADRSGTTLMYALLASHSHIAMPHLGSNMWTFFYGQFGDLRRRENFERCLAALVRYKNVLILNPDVERIRREFWRGAPTYARLFALFHDHFTERAGKLRWGDKTSYVERYADQIFAAYPGVQMIHLIRDPRDRYASAIKRWPQQKGQVGGATIRWLYSVGLAQRNLQRYPDRYKIVRYETLVTQPEATIRAVCEFLGEEFEPAMLTMAGAQGYVRKGGNSSFERFEPAQITTAAVGRYRQNISRREIEFIQIFAGRAMRAFDYALEQLPWSPCERVRFYLIDLPNHLARMVSWRALEALHQSLPAYLGRAPMRHRLINANP